MRNVNSHSPEHKPTTCSWGQEEIVSFSWFFYSCSLQVYLPLHHLHRRVRPQLSETRMCIWRQSSDISHWGYLVPWYEVQPELSFYAFLPWEFKSLLNAFTSFWCVWVRAELRLMFLPRWPSWFQNSNVTLQMEATCTSLSHRHPEKTLLRDKALHHSHFSPSELTTCLSNSHLTSRHIFSHGEVSLLASPWRFSRGCL